VTRSILIVVTHLLGVGHLTRAATLGRGLAGAGHRVTLATGGRRAPLVSTEGMTVVQLPPVHCRGVDFRTLLDEEGKPIDDHFRHDRLTMLLQALSDACPDLIITETFPFGRRQLAREFLALLEAAAALARPPAVLSSIRDILNPPSRFSRAVETEAILGRHFDGVLVHGDGAVTPLSASWPATPALERRLIYTGYVVEGIERMAPPRDGQGKEILVSGGGSAAGLPLFRAALAARRLVPGGHPWRLLVGHGVAQADFAALEGEAGEAIVERARPDFRHLLAGAALSVSQAGYNTMIDLALAGCRALLVPFEQGQEAEQRLRAERFGASGMAELLPESALSAPRLAAAIGQALAGPPPRKIPLALDGIGETIRAVEAKARDRDLRLSAWSRLATALDRLAAQDRILRIWWRDDDCRAPSPALDRLLDLARAHRAPVALAVIPAAVDPSLADRLACEALASVLVHGYAHRNHAPPHAKKEELSHRPLSDIETELTEGLARLIDLFGKRCLPVLVPPWNRLDRALVPRLAKLGFVGLSTFGAAPKPPPEGLILVNTHLDPIDWRGHRSLADEASLIERLADEIETRLADEAAPDEPLGLLTHHLAHDAWIWGFLERLLALLRAARNVDLVAAPTLF
jgi:predicted glycosyltransferase